MQIYFFVDDGCVEVEKRQSPRGQPVVFIRLSWIGLLFAVVVGYVPLCVCVLEALLLVIFDRL